MAASLLSSDAEQPKLGQGCDPVIQADLLDNLAVLEFDPTLTVPEHIAVATDGRIVVISVCYAQATARPSENP